MMILMIYQNVQSLGSKTHRLILNSTNCLFDFFFSQTWLLPRVCNAELFNDSFSVFRQDRSVPNSEKRSDGGVLIAIKAKYNCDIVEIQVKR